ncbi:MAG: DEAD/DEAH box helicase, partial [Gloeomargarita sp. DG02_3_bins_56]
MGKALTPDPQELFPFALDEFQLQAMAALAQGRSVVVCAPTGSGKTLVAEYAIHRALYQGERVFYTTPLKALSNQKFRDFRQQFGSEIVGLLTGDVCINRDAPIVVMTTEIFRNMLYGTPIGE